MHNQRFTRLPEQSFAHVELHCWIHLLEQLSEQAASTAALTSRRAPITRTRSDRPNIRRSRNQNSYLRNSSCKLCYSLRCNFQSDFSAASRTRTSTTAGTIIRTRSSARASTTPCRAPCRTRASAGAVARTRSSARASTSSRTRSLAASLHPPAQSLAHDATQDPVQFPCRSRLQLVQAVLHPVEHRPEQRPEHPLDASSFGIELSSLSTACRLAQPARCDLRPIFGCGRCSFDRIQRLCNFWICSFLMYAPAVGCVEKSYAEPL